MSTEPVDEAAPETGAHTTLSEQVSEQLRSRIIDGSLAPGAKLREAHLATSLAVSRVPVREALRILESEGFVTLVPHRGAVVRDLSARDVDELFDLRVALEGFAARQAARRCAEGADHSELDALLTEGQEASASGDPIRVLAATAAFHEAVVRLAGHGLLAEVVDPILSRTRWLFAQTADRDAEQQCAEHGEIHQAITRGEVDLAGYLATAHIESGRNPSLAAIAAKRS